MTPASPFPLPGAARTAFPAVDTRSVLRAPKRQRARDTEQALLAAGRALLATHDFEAMSVAQIVAACGLSVGAFYGRFRDKAAFFEALQATAMRDAQMAAQRYLAPQRWHAVPTAVVLDRTMHWLVRGCRAHRGMLHAALQQAATQAQAWQPHQEFATGVAEQMVALLAPRLDGDAQAGFKVRFAMQAAFALLVDTLRNGPLPLPLGDPRLPAQMARLVARYLAPA